MDELNSYLGVVLSGCEDGEVSSDLKDVQRMLFVAGADLAAGDGGGIPAAAGAGPPQRGLAAGSLCTNRVIVAGDRFATIG